MNEMKINVKAKDGGVAGYTFKLNEQKPKEIIPELVYLNENKFKHTIERLHDPEVKSILIGLGALPFIPTFLNAIQSQFVGFLSPVASVVKDEITSLFYTATNFLSEGPKAVVVNGSVDAVKRINDMDLYEKLEPIIDILQEIALPIGIIVSLWGCIEWIIGTPSWKTKIKTPIIGYAAIFGIPFIFKTIHDVLGAIA